MSAVHGGRREAGLFFLDESMGGMQVMLPSVAGGKRVRALTAVSSCYELKRKHLQRWWSPSPAKFADVWQSGKESGSVYVWLSDSAKLPLRPISMVVPCTQHRAPWKSERTEEDRWLSSELCYPALTEVTQGFMLDFISQSGALCTQVERLKGSLIGALFDTANDRHCSPLPLKALWNIQRTQIPFEVRHSWRTRQSSFACRKVFLIV